MSENISAEEKQKWHLWLDRCLPMIRAGAAKLVSKAGEPRVEIVYVDKYFEIRLGEVTPDTPVCSTGRS